MSVSVGHDAFFLFRYVIACCTVCNYASRALARRSLIAAMNSAEFTDVEV